MYVSSFDAGDQWDTTYTAWNWDAKVEFLALIKAAV